MVLTYILPYLQNIICKWLYSLDTKSFCFGSALNPDSSIHMNCSDSPWLFAVCGLCFAEDTFIYQKYSISNLVIVVNTFSPLALIATIGQWLPSFSNFVPVSYKRNVKEHVASKNGCTCGGCKYRVIGRANCPCCVVQKDINVIGGNWIGHIKFSCAQHLSQDLMYTFQYAFCSWILNRGWLTHDTV